MSLHHHNRCHPCDLCYIHIATPLSNHVIPSSSSIPRACSLFPQTIQTTFTTGTSNIRRTLTHNSHRYNNRRAHSNNSSSNNNSKSRENPLIQCTAVTSTSSDEISGTSDENNKGSLSIDVKKPNKWVVAVACSLIYALHTTAIYICPATLLHPMRESLNLSLTAITKPLLLFRILLTIFLVPASFIIKKVGAHKCIQFFVFLACITTPLQAFASSLSHLLILQTVFAVTKIFAGVSTLLLVTAKAFEGSNGFGTAASIVISGYSLAGFIAPTLLGILSNRFGWRVASFAISIFFSLTCLPLLYFVFKHDLTASPPLTPAQDNNNTNKMNINKIENKSEQTLTTMKGKSENIQNQRLLSLQFLTVFVSVACFNFSLHPMLDHLLLFLTDEVHLTFAKATRYLSLFNLVSLLSKLLSGPIADKYDKSKLICFYGLVGTCSSLLLLNLSKFFSCSTNPLNVLAFIILYGFSYSGVFSTTSSILPELGVDNLAVRSNLNITVALAAGSLGTWLATQLKSQTGTYYLSFVFNVAAFSIVTLCGVLNYFLKRKNRNKELKNC